MAKEKKTAKPAKRSAPKKAESKKQPAKKPPKKEIPPVKEIIPEQAAEKQVEGRPVVEPVRPEPAMPEVKAQEAERIKPKKERAHFYFGTGKRKTSVAKVRLYQGGGEFLVNGRKLSEYISERPLLETIAKKPLALTDNLKKFDVHVSAFGGGVASQADAIRHGVARALLQVNPDLKPTLKRDGLLTRDPRMKERKKYGRKRARKRFQYSKR